MLLQGTVDSKLLRAFRGAKKETSVGGVLPNRRGGGGGTSTASDAEIACITFASISSLWWSPLHPPSPFFFWGFFFFFFGDKLNRTKGLFPVALDGWRRNAVLKEEAVKLKFQNGAYCLYVSPLSCLCPPSPPLPFISITPAIMTFWSERKGQRQHFGAFLLLAESFLIGAKPALRPAL